ncbi:MAG: glucuronate isomerase [Gammaproteobacteria bacterium]|jgi:glucuronate isomerase|nr:glucuronate isomerase [Gammaproteobacteria bacterium]
MSRPLHLDPERFFPAEPHVRAIAGRLFSTVERLPIVSPHGHTDPAWFAANAPFEDAVSLLLWPDHYLLRMLMSAGVQLEQLGIQRSDGAAVERDRRAIWRRFAQNYRLFRGTPSRLWLDHVFASVFDLRERLDSDSADRYFDAISAALPAAEFRPRALYERFSIEVLATTEGALDSLEQHRAIQASGWHGRVITTFRPDDVIDPERPDFPANLKLLGEITGEDTGHWEGYLAALEKRRAFFRAHGATATDHGHPTALTADLALPAARELYLRVRNGSLGAGNAELFRAQMLTEMARMSCEDGMVMQLHAGAWRNHNATLFELFGRDRGGDVPTRSDFTAALKPLLDRFGMRSDFTLVVFTLDESTYSRELAPLAGHYPCLRVGPAWWFHDAPEAMLRYRRATTETAGFYNTAGFNDDTRAFFSIPARHDLARRVDCGYLAELVASHRLEEDEAADVAVDLAYRLPKAVYRL